MSEAKRPHPELTCEYVMGVVNQLGGKWAVIILGRDDGQTQFTTWGRHADDKVFAAWVSEEAAEATHGGPKTPIESFVADAAWQADKESLLSACQAVLLFHRGGPWDDDSWCRLTGGIDGTTRALCDFVRAAIDKAEGRARE